MKYLLLLITSLLILNEPAQSQRTDTMGMKSEAKAIFLINELKEGVLLVRLHTKSTGIEALKKKGQMEQAEKVRKYQQEENMEIMNAFRKYFRFCPVHFFFSDSSEALANGRPYHFFLDENLLIDSSIQPVGSFYLIAQNGDLKFMAEKGEEPPDGLLNNVLVILDSDYNQLQSPFPYFTRGKNWAMRVKRLNANFNEFYDQEN